MHTGVSVSTVPLLRKHCMNTERGNEVQPGEREKNEVTVRERRERESTWLEIVPLPSLPLSLLLCSHLQAHHSPIRSPIPSNSVPRRLSAAYEHTRSCIKRVFGCTSIVNAVRLVAASELRSGSVDKVKIENF